MKINDSKQRRSINTIPTLRSVSLLFWHDVFSNQKGVRMTTDIESILGKAKAEEESALKDKKPELMKQALQKVTDAKDMGNASIVDSTQQMFSSY